MFRAVRVSCDIGGSVISIDFEGVPVEAVDDVATVDITDEAVTAAVAAEVDMELGVEGLSFNAGPGFGVVTGTFAVDAVGKWLVERMSAGKAALAEVDDDAERTDAGLGVEARLVGKEAGVE
jgi:hypothetical protein